MQDYERLVAVSEEILAEGRRSGALVGVLTGVGYRGHVHDRRGELVEAEGELRTILDLVMASGMGLWITAAFYLFVEAILERPSLDDAARQGMALELEPRFLETASGAMVLEFRGRLALARGDRSAAVTELRAYAEIFRALRYGPLYSSWRSTLALALAPEQRAEAVALVDKELTLAQATGLERPCGVALRAAGLLEGGERGIALLRESAALLEAPDARLERARTLVALGSALRRRQRRAEAREHLAAGMELAHRCGAVRLQDGAGEELRAVGARPRRPARSGVDALTASELRVARRAAEGATNPEIAQGLYGSLKTVETHLSHVYAKLGLAGQGARRGLAAALGEAGRSLASLGTCLKAVRPACFETGSKPRAVGPSAPGPA